MVIADFEDLLRRASGLDAASIGSPAIERAVRERVSACKVRDLHGYWELLSGSDTELQELIEAVVIPETWFFRDRQAFTALVGLIREKSLRADAQSVLRVLSLPCSTGEEPYSIAMAVLDAGLPPTTFRVDGVDISTRALAQAARAVYGKNSFRSGDLSFRDRHFEAREGLYRLRDAVRGQVQLRQGNLLGADVLPGSEIYDAIFCRNVLIYFDRDTQDRAVAVLWRLLKPHGVLFVGPAESNLVFSHDFDSLALPSAFAFRKRTRAPSNPPTQAEPPQARHRVAALAPTVKRLPACPEAPRSSTRSRVAVEPVPWTKDGIDDIARLADQGRLPEAARLCEAHLRVHGPSAKAFHLMALICDADGDGRAAVQYFRKVLYLDPNHHEALVHLSFLLEKQGDAGGAKTLRSRLQRLAPKGVS